MKKLMTVFVLLTTLSQGAHALDKRCDPVELAEMELAGENGSEAYLRELLAFSNAKITAFESVNLEIQLKSAGAMMTVDPTATVASQVVINRLVSDWNGYRQCSERITKVLNENFSK